MSLRTDLNTILTNGVPLVDKRVYPLIMPQDTKKNSIVYTIINDLGNTGLCGVVTTSSIAIQVDVYAQTYSQSVDVMNEAIAALRAAFNVSGLQTFEMYEDITLKYRQVIDFRLKSYVKK